MGGGEADEHDLAVGHDNQRKRLGHSKRISARVAGSMDTTVSDFALFLRVVMRGEGGRGGIKLGYALSWGVFASPYGRAFFEKGHDDGWEHHFVCFPGKESCLVLMTNSSNGDEVFMDLFDELIAARSTPWRWEGYAPPKRRTGAPR